MSHPLLCATAAAALIACSASGDVYEIRFAGSIEWNQITQPPLSSGTAGSSAEVVMKVDSNVFSNSPNYPVRGYRIDPPSFKFIVNGTPVGMNPAIIAPQYFVIRDNDPGVDGFYISSEVDWPMGVELAQSHPVLGPFTEICGVTYGPSVLSSLNIEGAEGTYKYDTLEVFSWETSAGPFSPMGMIFDSITITRVAPPCPADLSGDGIVDGADLGTLLGAWNTSDAAADLNGDGTVDGADLGDLLGSWGACD
jgi:hypothetical protein